MKKDSIIDFLGFIVVKLSSLILCCMPLRPALCIARRFGDIAYLVNSKRRSIAYSNLKSVFPEKDASERNSILRSHFRNLGMSIVELLKFPAMAKGYLERHVCIKDADRIKDALRMGNGVILLTAHFGNWELASLAASYRGYSMSVFAREQRYARLNNLLNKYREMSGCRVIAKGFSAREIIKALRANGIVGMLSDQDAGSNGVFVDFLGRPTSVATGVIAFSQKTGAVVLPSYVWRERYDRHVVQIGEPLTFVNTGDPDRDVRFNLKKATDILEDYIRRYPDQWLWSHKRWKTTPQRTVLVLTDGKAGHINQSMAVAEMIEGALGSKLKSHGIKEPPIVKIHVVELRFKNKFLRAVMDICSIFAGRRCQGCLRCLRPCLKKDSFMNIKSRYADIIISCGASTVGTNIFLKYENNAKNIIIMRPGLGRSKRFNLVILPRHDEPGRLSSNMLVTQVAPNKVREGLIEHDALRTTPVRRGLGEGGNNGIGLLIGGDAKNFRLEEDTVDRVVEGVLMIAEETDRDIFISTSRRTSREISSSLKEKLGNNKRCRLLVIANEKNIEDAVPRIFGLSEVILVSSDSVSMISEAVSSGKYVVVFGAKGQGPGVRCKHKRFLENLEKAGFLKTAAPHEIHDTLKEIFIEKPMLKKLDDRDRIAERLRTII